MNRVGGDGVLLKKIKSKSIKLHNQPPQLELHVIFTEMYHSSLYDITVMEITVGQDDICSLYVHYENYCRNPLGTVKSMCEE